MSVLSRWFFGSALLVCGACGGRDAREAPTPTRPTVAAPAPDPSVAPPRRLAVRETYACVLRGGQVLCAGRAPGVESVGALAPLPWVTDVVEIDAGEAGLCARRANGTVRCAANDGTPFDLEGIPDARRLRVADVIGVQRGDGTIWIDPRDEAHVMRPLVASTDSVDATADFAIGQAHACALGARGSVACVDVGDGTIHRLLDRGGQGVGMDGLDVYVTRHDGAVSTDMLNDDRDRLYPADSFTGLRGIRGICGLRDGSAVCPTLDGYSWRVLEDGRLEGRPFVEVARTFDFACAIDTDAELACWGAASPIADLARAAFRSPTTVVGLSEVTSVSVAAEHACAVRAGGTVWCWGEGFGRTPRSVELSGLVGPIVELASNRLATCARDANGAVACFGRKLDADAMTTRAPTRFAPTRVVTGGSASLAVDGGSFWSRSTGGAVERFTPGASEPPTRDARFEGATSIAGGAAYFCGVVARELRCAGTESGLSMGASGTSFVPQALADVDEVAGGAESVCVRQGSTWRCVGHNGAGQLGAPPSRPTTDLVAFGTDLRSIALAHHRTCAVDARGAVVCAGVQPSGPRGFSEARGTGRVERLDGLDGARSIALADELACAAMLDGTARCWGASFAGGVGDGTRGVLDVATVIPLRALP